MKKCRSILPVDAECHTVDLEEKMLLELTRIAHKRTRRILHRATYGTDTLGALLEAAYLQGLTDMGEAVKEKVIEAENHS